jgi:phosphatidylglycerophosphatase A
LPLFPRPDQLILLAVTGAGVGYLPWLPGTFGTCLAIPLSLALNQLASMALYSALIALLGFTALAIWSSGKAAVILGLKDPRAIIIDEIAGFLVANFLNQSGLSSLILAFVLFRFFDIVKPFPVSQFEKLPGGFGIVLDDMVAGVYSLVILYLLGHWSVL